METNKHANDFFLNCEIKYNVFEQQTRLMMT